MFMLADSKTEYPERLWDSEYPYRHRVRMEIFIPRDVRSTRISLEKVALLSSLSNIEVFFYIRAM